MLYGIGITIGVKVILWIADQKTLDKWNGFIQKGKYTIFLLLLFPVTPEQIVMILCGSGKMKMRQYLPIIMIAQPIGVLTTIFAGKALFLFKPLWLFVPIGLILMGIIMFLAFKYQDKIDWLMDKVLRRDV